MNKSSNHPVILQYKQTHFNYPRLNMLLKSAVIQEMSSSHLASSIVYSNIPYGRKLHAKHSRRICSLPLWTKYIY